MQEAVTTLRPQWEDDLHYRWIAGEWGIKTRCVQTVWGNNYRYEGSFADWIEQAAAILEAETVANAAAAGEAAAYAAAAAAATATATATEQHTPIPATVVTDKTIATGSSRSSKYKSPFKETIYA